MYLLDTNVISELRKVESGRANPGLSAWAASIDVAALYLSVLTVQELELGILRLERRDAAQGALLRNWLEHQVLPAFAGRILPVSLPISRRCAALNVPDSRPLADSLIAATALEHDLLLVTRNVSDMVGTGVRLLNPFS